MIKFTIVLAGTIMFLISCNFGPNSTNKTEAIGNTTPGEPVEVRSPDAGYKPAFEGQTRAPGVKTNTPYEVRIISDKLNKPWGIALMPDGRFLITEKEGNMRIASTDGKLSEKITGIPPVVAKGQGGLLGLALHPDFATNRVVFWAFTEEVEKGNLASLATGVLSADERRIENASVIFRATPSYDGNNHYGGRLAFDDKGSLYFITGERFDKERRQNSQDPNSYLGKVMRIKMETASVMGNNNIKPEIISMGHRNPQGIAFHPETGELWVSEFGPRGGDELNLIEPGKNYGWPVISYGIEYTSFKVGEGITQRKGMEQPVYYWDPVLSPSGMTFYKSGAIPEWKNNLFIAGLNSHHIARIVIDGKRVVGEERIAADQQQRFRSVIEGNDGALYAITDEGRLYRIGKK